MSDGFVICGRRESQCQCVKPAGHKEQGDPVHGCDEGCGGSWRYEDGEFVPVTYPRGVPTGRPRNPVFSAPRGPIRFISAPFQVGPERLEGTK